MQDGTLVRNLLEATILTIVGLLCFGARQLITLGVNYLRTKITSSQFDQLKGYAKTAVRNLEQSGVFKDLDGSNKKEMAILDITQWAKAHNLPVDETFVGKLIEEAVHEMNVDLGNPLDDFFGSDTGYIGEDMSA